MVRARDDARAAGAVRGRADPQDRDPLAPARLPSTPPTSSPAGGRRGRARDRRRRAVRAWPRRRGSAATGRVERYLLLYPERGLVLNATAAGRRAPVHGEHTVGGHRGAAAPRSTRHEPREIVEREVLTFLATLADRGLVRLSREPAGAPAVRRERAPTRPYTLVAELTYRCPLRCVVLLEPAGLRAATTRARHGDLAPRARGGGGARRRAGEPDRRRAARCATISRRWSRGRGALDLYTNLITSGIPLARERLARLRELGLDNVQLSIQDVDRARRPTASPGSGRSTGSCEVAGWVKALGLPLTLNVGAPPRQPRSRAPRSIALAESTGRRSLELANTQYLGWALANRDGAAAVARRSSSAPARSRARPGSGCAARWRCCSSRPTTTPSSRRPAWTAGRGASSWSRPTGVALPCHAAHTHARASTFERGPRAAARRDLARVAGLQRVPRRGVDARAVPELRPPRRRLRRLPLPGVFTSRATRPPPTPSARSPRATSSSRPREASRASRPSSSTAGRARPRPRPAERGPALSLRRPLDPADHTALRVVAPAPRARSRPGSTPRPRRPPSR